MITMKVRAPKVNRELTFDIDIPPTIIEGAAALGEEVANSLWCNEITLWGQAKSRLLLEATTKEGDEETFKYTDEEVKTAMLNAKPGVKAIRGGGPSKSLKSQIQKMSKEERAALIAELQEEE